MNLQDIQNEWEQDTTIDRLNLSDESLKIPKLHSKYYKIYVHEVLQLKKLDSELKVLRLEKSEFYQYGPTQETHNKGWKLPDRGKVLKSDIPLFVDADKDVIQFTLKLALQKEKAEFVSSILKEIGQRSFHISNAVKFEIFKAGG